jgi:integrase
LERHLYQRTIGKTKSDKDIKAWYYWYYDPKTKKQVRKSCGTSKIPITSYKVAKSIIENMEAQDREYLAIRGEAESVTIAKLATSMFDEKSEYIKKRREEGYIKDCDALIDIKRYVDDFIVNNYGHLHPEQVDPVVVDSDLMKTELSTSWRNRAVQIFNNILDEAVWLKMIKIKPKLKTYKKITKKKSILSRVEMDRLFPNDFDELSRIWTRRQEVNTEGVMFGVLYALLLSTGLRNGEARAISPSQLILTDRIKIVKMLDVNGKEVENPLGITDRKIVYGIVVDRMYNRKKVVVRHLKKGEEGINPKMRIEVLPEKTVKYLKYWISVRQNDVCENCTDLLFYFRKLPITCENLITRLGIGLKNAGIDTVGRELKPHSLRFTYNTKMRRRISEDKLRDMMGHDYKGMTDYYTILNLAELEEQFIELHNDSEAIDSFWG